MYLVLRMSLLVYLTHSNLEYVLMPHIQELAYQFIVTLRNEAEHHILVVDSHSIMVVAIVTISH